MIDLSREGPGHPRLVLALIAALALAPAGCDWNRLPRADIDFPESWRYADRVNPVREPSAMISTVDAYATRVGLSVLEDGGNAVDAAIAISFSLAVVNPEAGNIGGGGFMVIRLAGGEVSTLDYRERAPEAASRDMYLDEQGEVTEASVRGHLAAGVPGSVMGLWEAHRRFGSLDWERLVGPAVELAEGFEVGEQLAASLRGARTSLEGFDATRSAFLPGGEPPAEGEIFRQPDLARTLSRVRDSGVDGFYGGVTADLIVEEMSRGGGLIVLEDLASYSAVWRDPVSFQYRGYTLHSMPPPSSGGATMALMAHIVEGYDLAELGWHSTRMIHLLAESWKRAYSDRNQVLADPDYVDLPLNRMISRGYGRERSADISLTTATPSADVGPGLVVSEGSETTHFSVVDEAGNAVAVSTTLNSLYGSKVTVGGAGFLLNNEMDDFAARPGFPNQFGLVQGEQNAIEPGKRMLSAMTPTVVESPEGELFLVLGTPGGGTIITTVFQTVVNVVDFGMSMAQAVNAPRVHHQHLPDRIMYERGGLTEEVADSLRALGHAIQERRGTSGDVQAIMVLPDRTLVGYADPRRGGLSAGY